MVSILRFKPPPDAPCAELAAFCQSQGLAMRDGRAILANPACAPATHYIGWIRERYLEWLAQGGSGHRIEFEDWLAA